MNNLSLYKKVALVVLMSQILTGFSMSDQFIELKEHVYARSSALFSRTRDNNKIGVLPPGTRGQISERVRLPSGNYGFLIRILNGPRSGQEAWVYYNVKNPMLSLYSSEHPSVQAVQPEEADTAVTKDNVPAISEVEKQVAATGKVAGVCLSDNRSLLTHYNSDPTSYRSQEEADMEGGSKTRYGEPLNSVEQAIHNGRPVSLAADIYGSFGKRCNKRNSRCTLLVYSRGFDKRYPNYKTKFPGLPADTFVGIVEDTGGAFYHKGTAKIDLAVRNRKIANGVSDKNMRFTEIANPCGKGKKARYCNLSGLNLVDQCQVAQNRVSMDSSTDSSTGTRTVRAKAGGVAAMR